MHTTTADQAIFLPAVRSSSPTRTDEDNAAPCYETWRDSQTAKHLQANEDALENHLVTILDAIDEAADAPRPSYEGWIEERAEAQKLADDEALEHHLVAILTAIDAEVASEASYSPCNSDVCTFSKGSSSSATSATTANLEARLLQLEEHDRRCRKMGLSRRLVVVAPERVGEKGLQKGWKRCWGRTRRFMSRTEKVRTVVKSAKELAMESEELAEEMEFLSPLSWMARDSLDLR